MQHILPRPTGADPQLLETMADLCRSTAQSVMLVTGLFYLAAIIVLAGNAPTSTMAGLLGLAGAFVLSVVVARRHLGRRYVAGQVLWQLVLAACSTLTIWLLRRPEAAFLYALLPLIAVITMGWPAGLLAEGLVIGLGLWVVGLPWMPSLPATYTLLIILSGALGGLLGWAATSSMITATEWSLFSAEQALRHLAAAREQRLELKQVQEDLVQANRELARLSDRLKVMNRVAKEARQAKTEFMANVSHELRTPLNMIIGFAEMISQSPRVYGDQLPPVLLSDIAAIQRNAQHLSRLVNDVLDLSQVEAGQMALSREWTSLGEVIREAVDVVAGLFSSKGLYLETRVPETLPEVFCDGLRVRQVIVNLLSNAGRFTDRGGVIVRCQHRERSLVTSVTDTGPGIAPEDQERIFQPFQQVDSSLRRKHGGSGLGLSISRQFVEMHGGTMWLESEQGQGTTISFSLPAETQAGHVTGGTDLPAVASGAARWLNPYEETGLRLRTRPFKAPPLAIGPRFVIVESEGALGRLFAHHAPEAEVLPTEDLDKALAELERAPAQGLLINQPPQESCRLSELAGLPYDTPVLSCWVPGTQEVSRRLGVVHYLVKPVSRERLLSTVRDVGSAIHTVLLVDDERDELHLFARMFASAPEGYRVLEATGGRRALSLMRNRRPDVLLLDLIMPGMSGLEVLLTKAGDPLIRDIPVIVVTSRDPAGGLSVGDTLSIMQKDLSARDLVRAIQAVGETLCPLGSSHGVAPPKS